MREALIVILSLISFFALSLLIFLFLIAPSSRRAKMEKYKGIHFAHRGLHSNSAPENSLLAFSRAVDAGFGIELDVRLSSDGTLMVFHDDTLERVTRESGRVDSKTCEELQKITLLDTNEKIPTLKEVLELVCGRVVLLVEIKEDANKCDVTKKTIEMLREYKGDFIIESFNPLALSLVKREMPNTMRGVLSENFLSEEKYRKPMYFFLQTLLLNVCCRPDFIAFNHKHYKNLSLRILRRMFGVFSLAWTVRSLSEEKECIDHGFDGIIFENYKP